MNAIPIPQPRTAGGRPPFDPPGKTTFDSTPGDNREPTHKVLADSVKHLLKHIAQSEPDQLWVMLRLIDERKELIERELAVERLLTTDNMPPLLKNLYSLEFLFEETEAARVYTRLLETLDEAREGILAKMLDQNTDAPASDL